MKVWGAIALSCMAGFSMQAYALSFSADYERCMRTAKSSTEAIRLCQIDELKDQNKRLKKIYKQTLKQSAAAEKQLVVNMQQQWYQQRVRTCQLQDKKLKAYSVMNSSCALQMTVTHADMMEVRLGNKILK